MPTNTHKHTHPEAQSLQALTHELHIIGFLGLLLLLLLFGWLGLVTNWWTALQWLVQAGLIAGYGWRFALTQLGSNRAMADAALYPSLGWGNRITLCRAWCIACCGGFMLLAHSHQLTVLLPAVAYSLAALLDRLDGLVARRSQQVSCLGSTLDIHFDALGLLVAPLLALSYGSIHPSYLLLSMAYYVYQWGIQLRRQRGLPLHPLPANPLRRTLAGFQMAFIALVLWPWINPGVTTLASIAFMLPVIFGFGVDWWVLTGKLPADSVPALEQRSATFLQPGLRLLLLVLLAILTPGFWAQSSPWIIVCICVATAMLSLGLLARIGAGLLLLLLGTLLPLDTIPWSGSLLIVCCSWLLLLGSGRFSLWQWDDAWVSRYAGA